MPIQLVGSKQLIDKMNESPAIVVKHYGYFIKRVMAVYKSLIRREPWRVGESGEGKGTPWATGYMRSQHYEVQIDKYTFALRATAPYALAVHDGTEGRMEGRPWLDIAQKEGEKEEKKLEDKMLTDIINELAR
jgi:hypothetical protein